jgi:subtilase family serine protease
MLAHALIGLTALYCAVTVQAQSFTPLRRIVNRIDENRLVTLKGNTPPAVNATNDRGRVSPDLPMTDMILVLSRDPAQQAAFEQFVASQYDPNSPNYHQWLTPEQVGQNFGPSDADLATVSNWLAGHGFSVDQITRDHMTIRFSGQASQVESAFHTEMHNLEVRGVAHIANISDPQIPAALVPTVVGVRALHNFYPRPLHHLGNAVMRDQATGLWQRGSMAAAAQSKTVSLARTSLARPEFGISVGGTSPYLVEDVDPFDFATIYNILPLWNAGTPIDGSGQTIAIAGTSSIVPQDVATFRSFFGLPAIDISGSPGKNTPAFTMISGNSQPLTKCTSTSSTAVCGQSDLIENSLDVEWAGAVAKGANIVLVSSYPASTSDDGLYDSESYIINNHTADIMNISYGQCELGNGTAGNVQYYNLWQAAAAEGISVFVAAGDSGAASCDQGQDTTYGVPYPAEFGLSVNGLASTPYNTAVGGTDFNWCSLMTLWNGGICTPAPYWNTTNSSSSAGSATAKNYVPELPWNDTCTSPLAVGFLGAYASSYYGISSVANAEEACNFVVDYSTGANSIQQTDPNLLNIVDTVGGGGGASNCVVNDGSKGSSCLSSITSTGSANGNLPLVNDGWPKPVWQTGVGGIPSDGVRDIPDVSFFASDGYLSSSAYLICVSDVTACTYSIKSEPIAQEVGGTSVATPAMAGVMALINQKAGAAQGNPNAELYKLASQQNYSNCSAESTTVGNKCYFNDIDQGTIAMACDHGAYGSTSPNCPAPSYSVGGSADQVGILSGYNAGTGYDLATGLGSLNVANVVNAWTASTGLTGSTFSLTASTPTPIAPGENSTSTITVSALNGYTGTVTLTCQLSSTTASGGDGVGCSIPSSAVAMGATAIATVTTTAPVTAALTHPKQPGTGWKGAEGGALLALLFFFGIPARRRSWRSMLGVLVLMATLGSLVACGSGGGSGITKQSDPGTTAGTYTFTVQATGNPSVNPAVSTTFAVTVN